MIIFGLYIQRNTNFGKLFSRFSTYNSNTYNNITGVDLRYENDINRTQNTLKYSSLFKKKRLLDLLNDPTVPIFYKLQLIEKYNLENDEDLLQNNRIRGNNIRGNNIRGNNYGEDLMREFYKK